MTSSMIIELAGNPNKFDKARDKAHDNKLVLKNSKENSHEQYY